MHLDPSVLSTLGRLAKLRPAEAVSDEAKETPEQAAAVLRNLGYPHPKQAAFFRRSKAAWKATCKTRRAGATAGGVREFLARAIEQPGFRATYVTTTRQEAHDRAWENDNDSGFVQILRKYATPRRHPTLKEAFVWGGVQIDVREGDLVLKFSNGSHIELFGADNVRRHRTKRGNSKHVFWIDEAQDFPSLDVFFDRVVIGSLTDYEGEAWITGTPGVDCVGMFYDITKDVDDGRIEGWEVHTIAVVDNPYFGHVVTDTTDGATIYYVEDNAGERSGPYDTTEQAEKIAVEVRWERTAGAAKRKKNWKGTEPDFVREWLGRWVKDDARFVYPVHAVPKHVLIYAPQRLADNPFWSTDDRFKDHPPWYDHNAALADLPHPPRNWGRREYQWLFGLWVDFGYNPDPFAIVIGAFTPDLNDVYEMFSWKCTKVHTDDQGGYMKLAYDTVDSLVSFVGDPAGKQDDFEVWKTRMNLPITEANKQGKNTLEEFLADDIRRGWYHLRAEPDGKNPSPLYLEMQHLVYLPGKPGKTREVHKHRKVNGIEYGDHCVDAARYGHADLTHYLARAPEEKPPAGSREALQAEADREEERLDARMARQQRAYEEGDEVPGEYNQTENTVYGSHAYDY